MRDQESSLVPVLAMWLVDDCCWRCLLPAWSHKGRHALSALMIPVLLLVTAGGGVSPPYTSSVTNVSYFMNTTSDGMTFNDAEQSCLENGGHLVAYASLDEQTEVEKYFMDRGWWLQYYQKVSVQTGPA